MSLTLLALFSLKWRWHDKESCWILLLFFPLPIIIMTWWISVMKMILQVLFHQNNDIDQNIKSIWKDSCTCMLNISLLWFMKQYYFPYESFLYIQTNYSKHFSKLLHTIQSKSVFIYVCILKENIWSLWIICQW